MADAVALPAIDILIEAGDWHGEPEMAALCRGAIAAALRAAPLRLASGSELSILLTDDRGITALNRSWRGIDKPTNVLSFPALEVTAEQTAGPVLGDIALAHETIAHEASLEEVPFDDHFRHLLIHGFLHLFGYDHEHDHEAEVMEELERRALAELGIEDPYA